MLRSRITRSLLATAAFLPILSMISCFGGDDWCCDDPYSFFGGSALSPSRYVFVGNRSTLLYTIDDTNYTRASLGGTYRLRDALLRPDYGLAVGNSGTVLRTSGSDYGTNWGKIDVGVTYDFNRISGVPDDLRVSYIAGDGGNVLKSTNSGLNWTAQRAGVDLTPDSNLYGISCVNSNTCWTVGALGKIYKTTDGSNWDYQSSGTTETLNDIFAYDANTAWAVGRNGTLTYTEDGGTTWELHNTGFNENLRRVYFASRLEGIVLGDNLLARTTDGGEEFDRLDETYSELRRNWKGLTYSGRSIWLGSKDCDEPRVAFSPDFGVNWEYRVIEPSLFGVVLPTAAPTTEPQETPGTTATPTVVPTTPQTGGATPTATAAPTEVPSATGCAALSGSYTGDGGCNLNSLSVGSNGGSDVTFQSFGTNGSQQFTYSGQAGTSSSTNLTLFGSANHTCIISCASGGASFDVHCERNGNSSISCDEHFS